MRIRLRTISLVSFLAVLACSESRKSEDKRAGADPGKGESAMPNRSEPPILAEFPHSRPPFAIAKVAGRSNTPSGEFEGKPEWEKARVKKPGMGLYYLFLCASDRETGIVLKESGLSQTVPASHPVYRMPGSPVFTFFLSDDAHPGILEFRHLWKAETLDLAHLESPLSGLSPFWNSETPASIAFDDLPAWLETHGP